MQPQRSSGGITLTELHVVIAILAILATILFPVFAQAREKVRQIAYLSNSKQFCLAFMWYIRTTTSRVPTGPPPPAAARLGQ
jgi:type II secretory pathway pseudopilin PulG